MATKPYTYILHQIQKLNVDEQRQLLAELAELVQHPPGRAVARPPRSITELDGLGKDVWKDVDVDRYLDEERRSWDG